MVDQIIGTLWPLGPNKFTHKIITSIILLVKDNTSLYHLNIRSEIRLLLCDHLVKGQSQEKKKQI